MPVTEYRVMDYRRGQDSHLWTVAEVSLPDAGIPSRRLPTWDVFFRRYADERATGFYCECTRIGPGARLINCEHIFASVFHITRVKGPWEEDRVLMEKAWELVSGMKKEKPNFTVRRDENSPYGDESFMVYQPGIGGVRIDKTINTAGVWYVCGCGKDGRDACDHIMAVREFEKNETPQVITKGPWASAGVVLPDIEKELGEKISKALDAQIYASVFGVDRASKEGDRLTYSTRGTYSDRDGTFRPEDLEKIKAAVENFKFSPMNFNFQLEKNTEALKNLSDAYLEADDRKEPDPPKEPKKPRSRFSEIDL